MSLPKLVTKTRQKITLPVFTPTAEAGGAPQAATTISFGLQTQEQEQWCWAAVSVSVSLFYDAGSGWTQCSLVNDILNRGDCCWNGSAKACNQPHNLSDPLSRVGNFNSMSGSAASFNDVVTEIGSNHPLGCRIGWNDGISGHFVVVHGYAKGGNGSWVTVADPFYGPSTYVYELFCTSYRNSGEWTHSYFTQA